MAKEMNEIEDAAREDTNMLRMWRRIVTLIVFSTFSTVLAGAIVFLKREEKQNAHEDVSQTMKETYQKRILCSTLYSPSYYFHEFEVPFVCYCRG